MPSLTKKAESAILLYLQSLGLPTANIYAGDSSQTKAYPEIIVSVSEGEEDPPLTGNYWLDVRLIIRSAMVLEGGVDPVTAHDALTEAVFDGFASTSLWSNLTSYGTNFTVNGQLPFRLTEQPESDHFESTVEGRIVGMGQSFPN